MQLSQLKPPPSSAGTILQVPQDVRVEHSDIKQILHWYKDEFILTKDAAYQNAELKVAIEFSSYPFVKSPMPFISSNLINLAIDQCAIIHTGLMIKYGYIRLSMADEHGEEKWMTFEDYNRIVGDEFVTAKLDAKYKKPIPSFQKIEIRSHFLNMRRGSNGRYVFRFLLESKTLFVISLVFVYPLNLSFVRR